MQGWYFIIIGVLILIGFIFTGYALRRVDNYGDSEEFNIFVKELKRMIMDIETPDDYYEAMEAYSALINRSYGNISKDTVQNIYRQLQDAKKKLTDIGYIVKLVGHESN